jgi:hypothetical protein
VVAGLAALGAFTFNEPVTVMPGSATDGALS